MNFLHFNRLDPARLGRVETPLRRFRRLPARRPVVLDFKARSGVFEDVVIAAVIVVIVWFVVRKVRTVIRNRKSADGNE